MYMQLNNDEKKYRFFDPFTGEAPLKADTSRAVDQHLEDQLAFC